METEKPTRERDTQDRRRTVTLLPPTYVAVVAVEKVLSTVPEAIENSLVASMHGPGDVHVVLVG